MSDGFQARAKRLRDAFDRSFADSREKLQPATVDLLGVRVAGELYAVRLSQVAALHVDRKPAPLPSPDPTVTGVVSLRGVLHTVFDLRALLGASTAAPARWLIALAGAAAAFAFDGFDGLLRVETASVVPAVTGQPFVDELWLGPPRRPVLHLTSTAVIESKGS